MVPHPQLLAAIVEASADAISSRTLDGTLLTWNKGAEKVYGYTAEEAINGRDPSLLIRLAEKAMDDAKKTGRNNYRLYLPQAN